jgi:hypothetical protein
MRQSAQGDGIEVRLVAGTYVVLIGISVDPKRVEGLLGFTIERTDHSEGEKYHLYNNLLFDRNDNGRKADYSSETNPIQAFVWGDYAAKPDHTYTYEVTARYGTPARLQEGPGVAAPVTTENPDDGKHGVYFNRGVAASSAYERRFGDQSPAKVPNEEAYRWLSRGVEEALVGFIGRAVDDRYSLRASMYEFNFEPVLDAFRVAHEAGADVRIVYHKVGSKGAAVSNAKAISGARIKGLSTPRGTPPAKINISHNKFVVLLKDGKPIEVWTGSTNITEGGIYGHANVGHCVRDARIAARYLDYWQQLSQNPGDEIKGFDDPSPKFPSARPRAQLSTVFSPRSDLRSLEWYVRMADSAEQAVLLTAAFGLQPEIEPAFAGDRDYLRYLLLDTDNGEVKALRRDPDNVVTAGGYSGKGAYKAWIAQALRGLNGFVDYVHTKLMLIDPLGDDPIVITGSGNWSSESCEDNDENMLVIRGDKRVADIYLTEFMRLFNHYRLRGKAGTPEDKPAPGPEAPRASNRAKLHLEEDDSWARSFYAKDAGGKDTPEAKERKFFSGAAA